ncbi:hypothetical protein HN51_028843 [Arachis hypogaea]|uniref:Uncharacterized protein n=2 Tax=Arachis TaxID=3817 RepID=A0A445BGY5_ARAHY|nr:uncharacterized protein LOC107466516 [Arachis duranensis]XP_025619882.1 uncharacterized protein LOC112711439 [Arachis hypogaea]QHO35407.1 uncharacterized protein DS421_9g275180 [Arachis hypogaea]RYR37926.1 hypothetical protein Ahy_A09g042843 [Arachis hypogaea]
MQNSVRNYLTGQPKLFSTENKTSSVEVYLPSNKYRSSVYGLPVPPYGEVQGDIEVRSYIQDETVDAKFSQLNQAAQQLDQSHEQDMEIGYEEGTPPPPTYEGLEQRFIDEITKLARERSDAEDAEFARHTERILEINKEYHEKLSALRNLQATRREEFLRKELQARLNQYQESKRNYSPHMKVPVPDDHGFTSPSTFTAEANSMFHGAIKYNKHDRERTMSLSSGRSQGSEARVPLPPGRVYNNSTPYH